MNIIIEEYNPLVPSSLIKNSNLNVDNDIVIDKDFIALFNSLSEYEGLRKRLLNSSGDMIIYLFLWRKNVDRYMDCLKHSVNLLSLNTDVDNIIIRFVTNDYESHRKRIENCLFSGPVSYSGRVVKLLILRTLLIKILGLNIGLRLLSIIRKTNRGLGR